MADAPVTCITKPNRESQHEHVTRLGGAEWKWTREQLIHLASARNAPSISRLDGAHEDEGVYIYIRSCAQLDEVGLAWKSD